MKIILGVVVNVLNDVVANVLDNVVANVLDDVVANVLDDEHLVNVVQTPVIPLLSFLD